MGKRSPSSAGYYKNTNVNERKLRHILKSSGSQAAYVWADTKGCTSVLSSISRGDGKFAERALAALGLSGKV